MGLFFREDVGDRAPMTFAVCEKEGVLRAVARNASQAFISQENENDTVDAGVRVSMTKLLSSIKNFQELSLGDQNWRTIPMPSAVLPH